MNEGKKSLLLVIIAYITWGVLPGYWHLLSPVNPMEVLAHRILWSVMFLAVLLATRGNLLRTISKLRDRRILKTILCSSALICGNWLLYVWSLGHGYFIEAGLGYYICPLITVALGRIVLKEKLDRIKTIAIGFVALGVAYKIFSSGAMPWIALGLAATFAVYTLSKKSAALHAIEALFLETFLTALPAAAYLLYLAWRGESGFISQGNEIRFLLSISGIVTAVPLLWLASGAPRVSLQTISVVQFINPTLNIVIGLFNGHILTAQELPAYVLIWLGIGVYILPALRIFFCVTKVSATQRTKGNKLLPVV